MDINSRFEIAARTPGFVDALVACAHAGDGISVNEELCAGESGKYIDAGFFDLFAEPSRELVQRDNVIAVILQRRRNNREAEFAILRQKKDVIFLDRAFDGSASLLPIRHQFV